MSQKRLLSIIAAGLLYASAARAEPDKASSAAAAEHFRRGLAHAKEAELGLAASEFEAAYAKSPHYSVLYNLGQAYTALGRPTDAISAFERYLSEGGSSIDAARREQVKSLIALNRERVGRLTLHAGAGTRVWLDGKELEPAQLGKPLLLAAGTHTLLSASGSGPPASRTLSISAGRDVTLELPASSAVPSPPPGPLASLAPAQRAWLKVQVTPGDARVHVDGRRFASGALPAGRHGLLVERTGYLTEQRELDIAAGQTLTISVALALSPAERKLRARASAERTAGWVLGGVGGLFVTGGAGLLVYNAGEYDDWQARKASASQSDNLHSATAIQRVDDVSIGLLIVGAGLLGAGTWLLWPTTSSQSQ